MALMLHVEPQPLQRRPAPPSRLPAWRLIQREADRTSPDLHLLWLTLLTDLRHGVDDDALHEALASGSRPAAEAALTSAWSADVETPARATLPLLLGATLTQTAEALIPATAATLGTTEPLRFLPTLPEVLAAVAAYVGTQVLAIGEITRATMRMVLRQTIALGGSVRQQVRQVRTVLGLTPRQAEALETRQAQWQAQGLTAGQVQRQTAAAAQRGLRQRAQQIAQTQAMTSANMGHQALLEQAERAGVLEGDRVRRFWVTEGERPCASICAPIPGMNPDGVGLDEPFQTPIGPLRSPTAHPLCRCTVTARMAA